MYPEGRPGTQEAESELRAEVGAEQRESHPAAAVISTHVLPASRPPADQEHLPHPLTVTPFPAPARPRLVAQRLLLSGGQVHAQPSTQHRRPCFPGLSLLLCRLGGLDTLSSAPQPPFWTLWTLNTNAT